MSRKPRTTSKPTTSPGRIPGVVIAYIHAAETSPYFTRSLSLTQMADVAAEDLKIRRRRIVNIIEEWSSANVSSARNTLTAQFLDARKDGKEVGDWLLWIDADMQWEPEAIEYLMQTADPQERPIVGGLCFGLVHDELVPTIYQLGQLEDGNLHTFRPASYPRDSLVKCAATGAAFFLVHRRVLEAMRAAEFNSAFPWFQEMQMGSAPAGEDICFFLRAASLGFPIHVDTRAKIGHHKSTLLTEDKYLAQPAAPLDDHVGLVIPTRGDHPDLVQAIIATAGIPRERVVLINTSGEPMYAPATVLASSVLNIHHWWNVGIERLAERGCTRVAVLNDDVVIAPDTLPKMVRAMGSATLALAADEGTSGHCWVLNVTHGVRPDESYRWYSGDLQLIADAERAQGVVRVPEAWCLHLCPTQATEASPELRELAAADDALYDSRHPAGSRFAAIRKE